MIYKPSVWSSKAVIFKYQRAKPSGMLFDIIILAITLIALIIASYTDLKTREVPYWLNYSLIFIGLSLRAIYSSITWDYWPFIDGLIGFGVFFALASIMFYSGQWGGGDAKLLMGLGALLGLQFKADNLLVALIVNTFIVGAIYGLFWSAGLAVKNWKKFMPVLKEIIYHPRMILIRKIFIVYSIILLAMIIFFKDSFVRISLLLVMILPLFTFYLWIFVRAIERSCMLKKVDPEKITIGDWIPEDIIINGKRIAGPKDLGIEEPQIKKLIELKRKGKIRQVLIKEGIPFIPSFLIAFIIAYFAGNIILLFI
jgi:Flp pilus assembly protein protease CpaA